MKYAVKATTQITTYLETTIEHELLLATFRDYDDAVKYFREYIKSLPSVDYECHEDNDKHQRKDFWANVTDFCTIWVHLEVN